MVLWTLWWPRTSSALTSRTLLKAGQPWHSLSNNVFDGAASCTLDLVLVVAGMAGGMQVTKEMLKILGMM